MRSWRILTILAIILVFGSVGFMLARIKPVSERPVAPKTVDMETSRPVPEESYRDEPGLPKRALVRRGPLTVRYGPNEDYSPVARAKRKANLTYLGSLDGWVRVQVSPEVWGWVPGDSVELQDPGTGTIYLIKPGRWEVRFKKESPLENILLEWSDGIARLTIQGRIPDSLSYGESDNGRVIEIMYPGEALVPSAIRIASKGFESLETRPDRLLLELEQRTLYRVVESGSDRLTLEFSSAVTGIYRRQLPGRTQITIDTIGYVEPRLRTDKGVLSLELPNIRLMTEPEPGEWPWDGGDVTLIRQENNITLKFAGIRFPYLIRQFEDRVSLEYLNPGLQNKLIMIDPGHGGEDLGAVGRTGIVEKDVNLAIARRLEQILSQKGARVLLTRDRDQEVGGPLPDDEYKRRVRELGARARFAREQGADLFLSIHNDWNQDSSLRGTSTFFSKYNLNSAASQRLAGLAQEELLKTLGTRNRGVKDDQFYVIKHSQVPAALAEVLFISNPSEEKLLASEEVLDQVAAALTRALERYFEGEEPKLVPGRRAPRGWTPD